MSVTFYNLPVFILFLLLWNKSIGQVEGTSSELMHDSTTMERAFSSENLRETIDYRHFNKGNIHNVLSAIQGKVSGFEMYTFGDNPTAQQYTRMRGLSSILNQRTILYEVDGFLMADIENIDPYDIASVTFLENPLDVAAYGILGGSGVVQIKTKKAATKGIGVSYNNNFSLSQVEQFVPVFNREQYIAAGGNDLGGDNNWQEYISQDAWSMAHNLVLSYGNQRTTARLSGNIRDQKSVTKKAGFTSTNVLAQVSHLMLDDKLELKGSFSYTDKALDYSTPDLLKYAVSFLPSAPEKHESGDYYQPILFDNINPAVLLHLGANLGAKQLMNYHLQSTYRINSKMKFTGRFGRQINEERVAEYLGPHVSTSSSSVLGTAQRLLGNDELTQFEGFFHFDNDAGSKTQISIKTGLFYQDRDFDFTISNYQDFSQTIEPSGILDISKEELETITNQNQTKSYALLNQRVLSPQVHFNVAFSNDFYIKSLLRADTYYDDNLKLHYGLQFGYNVNRMLKIPRLDYVNMHWGTGSASNIYNQSTTFAFEEFFNQKIDNIQPTSLLLETVKQSNFGMDIKHKIWQFSFNLFNKRAEDVYSTGLVNDLAPRGNISLQTKGFDAWLQIEKDLSSSVQWYSRLALNSQKNTLTELPVNMLESGFPGVPGACCSTINNNVEGEQLGQIWTPEHLGRDAEGVELEDGIPRDRGNGAPNLTFSLDNSFNIKNFEVGIFLRGAFGHKIFNMARFAYESTHESKIDVYNVVNTEKRMDDISFSKVTDRFVENANFLRIDNLYLAYTIPKSEGKGLENLKIFASIQNAFTFTSYSGLSPEPVLADFGFRQFATSQNGLDRFSTGIDREHNFLHARTFTLGLRAGFGFKNP